jgi:hypothetical protein
LACWFWRRRFLKIVSVFLLFFYYLPLEIGYPLRLNKLEFPPPKDDLCQVWLKLAQWFWRRSKKCKSLQTDGQTDRRQDRQMDAGQWVIRKAHELKMNLNYTINNINVNLLNALKMLILDKLKVSQDTFRYNFSKFKVGQVNFVAGQVDMVFLLVLGQALTSMIFSAVIFSQMRVQSHNSLFECRQHLTVEYSGSHSIYFFYLVALAMAKYPLFMARIYDDGQAQITIDHISDPD